MRTSAYSDLVIEHFERPRNRGSLPPDPDVIAGSAGRPADGAQFTLTARVVGDAIGDTRFQAFGCPHSIAAASWLTERLVGKTVGDLDQWRWQEAAELLGVPAAKRGRLLTLEDAVRALADNWRRKAHNQP